MPRQDAPPVEDTSLAALLAGHGLPADADAELRPVADLLAALTARPAGGELAGLAAARAEFGRRVAVPVRLRRSPRWRLVGLVSQLGVKAAAATAVVVMGVGGAAAAAYAGALPSSWQQFAHRTIGAPVRATGHDTRAATGAAAPAAHPKARHHQYQLPSSGPSARYAFTPHTRPAFHARWPAARPFRHRGGPPTAPAGGRWRSPHPRRDASVSNAGSARGVS